ncbi:MAG: phytoene desaturase family protein, partial [Vicinamibacteria bacterium]
LALAGKSVLVLDHHYLPGGYCTAFPRKKYIFDAAVHHIGGAGRFGIIGQVLRRLDIDVKLVRLDPMDHLIFPDFEFTIPADLDEYGEALARRFPREKRRVPEFTRDLVRLYRQILAGNTARPGGALREDGDLLRRYRGATFARMLDDYFEDPALKRVLGGQWGYLGSPVEEISAVGMSQMLVNYLKDGAYYPIGSTQAFSDALARSLLRRGVHLLLKHRVEEILVEGERSAGVRIEGGAAVRAPIVVSNVDGRQLFHDLLPAGVCESERKRIRELRAASSYFGLYLALARDADLSTLPRGFYHLDKSEGDGAIDWIYLSVTTEIDPNLAPGGARIVSATVGVRADTPAFRIWQEEKGAMARAALRYLEQRVPNLGAKIEFQEAASPKTLARYTLSKDGVAYGWAVVPDQAGDARFPQTTSLGGLYLAGQWTSPGPGVCAVAASGWSVANRILFEESRAISPRSGNLKRGRDVGPARIPARRSAAGKLV